MRSRVYHSWSIIGLLGLVLSGCAGGTVSPAPTSGAGVPPTTVPHTTATAASGLASAASGLASATSVPGATGPEPAPATAAAALRYLLPTQLPEGYFIDDIDLAFADETGFLIQVRIDNDPAANTIQLLGGAPVEALARQAEAALRAQAPGSYEEAVTVRGQAGVMNGSTISWYEQGVPYMINGPLEAATLIAIINALEALDRDTWLQRTNLAKAPTQGMRVVAVEPGSVAEWAGFRNGQLLLSLASIPIERAETVNELIAAELNNSISATVWDNQRRLGFSFTPTEPLIGLTLCAPQRCAAPTETVPTGTMLYPCSQGLCLAALGSEETHVLQTFDVPTDALAGFALSHRGDQLAYGVIVQPGTADIYIQQVDGQPRKVRTVTGAINGLGELEGFGVIGFNADDRSLIIEDQAQVFEIESDRTKPRPITKQLLYGASSTHTFTLSSDGTYLLLTNSSSPNAATLYWVADGTQQIVELPADQRVIGLYGIGPQLLINRFYPPVDPSTGNPRGVDRTTIGYLVARQDGQPLRPLPASGKQAAPTLISGISSTYALFQSVNGTYLLCNLTTGLQLPIAPPPGHILGTHVELTITAPRGWWY